MSRQRIDLTGKSFGKWTVISPGTSRGYKWLCRCECGVEKVVAVYSLIGEQTLGCYSCITGKKRCRDGNLNRCQMAGAVPNWYYKRMCAGAKQRQLAVEVTLENIALLFDAQGAKCALTGLVLAFHRKKRVANTASLDRINSSKGYIPGNVQWVHKDVNKMKLNLPQERLLELAWLIVQQHKPHYTESEVCHGE